MSVPPTCSEPRDGFSFGVCSGTSVPSTRGVAASFLTHCRGNRLLRPRRCGDFGLVSRHDISASPDVAASCLSRRRAIAISTHFTRRGAAAKSTPLTRRGPAARSTPKPCGASAGHVVEYNVMDLMVGNRRAPGATILGFVSRRRVLYFVMSGPVDSVRDGVLPEECAVAAATTLFHVVAATLLSLVTSLLSAYGIPMFGLRAPFVAARPPDPVFHCGLVQAFQSDRPVPRQTISRRQLVMARPRASRSSSHRDERWEGCKV